MRIHDSKNLFRLEAICLETDGAFMAIGCIAYYSLPVPFDPIILTGQKKRDQEIRWKKSREAGRDTGNQSMEI